MPELAQKLWMQLGPTGKLALQGTLGAGKTTLVQHMGRALHIDEPIDSPTFTIMHSYGTPPQLFHFDCYRMEEPEAFLELGLEEYFYQDDAPVLVEWPERIIEYIPEHFHWLRIEVRDDGRRDYHLFSPNNMRKGQSS